MSTPRPVSMTRNAASIAGSDEAVGMSAAPAEASKTDAVKGPCGRGAS